MVCIEYCHSIGVPSSQKAGLEWLYNSTDGDHWNWNSVINNNTASSTPWNFTIGSNSDPCLNSWEGITCNKNCFDVNISACTILKLV